MTKTELLAMLEMKPEDLLHYGRKGMKWYQSIYGSKDKKSSGGRRSGQNSTNQRSNNRSSTKARTSKTRRDDNDEDNRPLYKKSSDKKRQAKKARRLSDRDLERAIKRLEQEEKYTRLTYQESAGTKIKNWVVDSGKRTVTTAVTTAGSKILSNKILGTYDKHFGTSLSDNGKKGGRSGKS